MRKSNFPSLNCKQKILKLQGQKVKVLLVRMGKIFRTSFDCIDCSALLDCIDFSALLDYIDCNIFNCIDCSALLEGRLSQVGWRKPGLHQSRPSLPFPSTACAFYICSQLKAGVLFQIYRMWKILHVFCSKYIACIKYSITYGPQLALLSCSHYYNWNQLSFVSLCKYSLQLYFKFKLMNINVKRET